MVGSRDSWDARALPSLAGRTYLVTGATSGLGFFSAEQLAAAGAHVILSGRNVNKLTAARAAIGRRVAGASLESMIIDVTKRSVVRSAAASLSSHDRLDGVILNAGIVHPPRKREEVDGHEVVLTTNVLGHFALAAGLLPTLAKAGRDYGTGRMVWLGSVSTASWKTIKVDPELTENYSGPRAYVQSKFMVQTLAAEAQRRLDEANVAVTSVIAHPGYSLSGRTEAVAGVNEVRRLKRFFANLQAPVSQSKELGATAQVRALIDPLVQGGDLIGPARTFTGPPRIYPAAKPTKLTERSRRPEVGRDVWEFCESATRTVWPFTAAQSPRD
ncbi:SDR family NAD(P)-dependent oxidoreductase [Microbacterium sp. NC79]|uniref:SDR family NAD(P)-dependent oxidoreductase n=1 Tax=Microbacterium sp. NC79 TaxID=2851009 RepID=UPI001C2C1D3B|nr:SDR family NAD(P)-dependent oxidoreductase [Microbacterium sp. NC79]